jgi:hypothetical protein
MSTRVTTRVQRRAPAARVVSALLVGAVACLLSGVWSADAAPPADDESNPPPVPAQPPGTTAEGQSTDEASPPSVPPDAESSYLVRVYKIRPAKLFKDLLESLTAEGYPPEEVDEQGRTVKSSFVDFKQADFELQVAEPPPRLSGSYHVMQLLKIKAGKVSLEGVVAQGKDGTELRMRARILVMGFDRAKQLRVFVDRRSSGSIEADFIHKFEVRMGLEHL